MDQRAQGLIRLRQPSHSVSPATGSHQVLAGRLAAARAPDSKKAYSASGRTHIGYSLAGGKWPLFPVNTLWLFDVGIWFALRGVRLCAFTKTGCAPHLTCGPEGPIGGVRLCRISTRSGYHFGYSSFHHSFIIHCHHYHCHQYCYHSLLWSCSSVFVSVVLTPLSLVQCQHRSLNR